MRGHGRQVRVASETLSERLESVTALELPDKYKSPGRLVPFLHVLPGELRNNIYKLLDFKVGKRRDVLREKEHPLAWLSRDFPYLRAEINSLTFADCSFQVDVYSNFTVYGGIVSLHRAGEQSAAFGVGKMVIDPNHWIFDKSAGTFFKSICLHIKEKGGFLIADVFLNANPEAGKDRFAEGKLPFSNSRAKILVTNHASTSIKKNMDIMTSKARLYIKQLNNDKTWNSFTIQQLKIVAACFEWTQLDMEIDYDRIRQGPIKRKYHAK